MRHNLEKYDSYEMRTALLFGWGAFVLFFAAVLCNRSPDLGFATFTLIFGAILATLTAGYWFLRAFAPLVAADEVAEDTAEPEALPQPSAKTIRYLDEESMRYCYKLKFFCDQAVEKGLLSQPAWKRAHDWPASAFEDYMRELQAACIVAAPAAAGARRELLITNLAEAYALLSQHLGFNLIGSIDYSRRINQGGVSITTDEGYSPSEED